MSPLDDGIEATITTPVASTRPSSSSIFSHSQQQNELLIGETSPNVMDEDCDNEVGDSLNKLKISIGVIMNANFSFILALLSHFVSTSVAFRINGQT